MDGLTIFVVCLLISLTILGVYYWKFSYSSVECPTCPTLSTDCPPCPICPLSSPTGPSGPNPPTPTPTPSAPSQTYPLPYQWYLSKAGILTMCPNGPNSGQNCVVRKNPKIFIGSQCRPSSKNGDTMWLTDKYNRLYSQSDPTVFLAPLKESTSIKNIQIMTQNGGWANLCEKSDNYGQRFSIFKNCDPMSVVLEKDPSSNYQFIKNVLSNEYINKNGQSIQYKIDATANFTVNTPIGQKTIILKNSSLSCVHYPQPDGSFFMWTSDGTYLDENMKPTASNPALFQYDESKQLLQVNVNGTWKTVGLDENRNFCVNKTGCFDCKVVMTQTSSPAKFLYNDTTQLLTVLDNNVNTPVGVDEKGYWKLGKNSSIKFVPSQTIPDTGDIPFIFTTEDKAPAWTGPGIGTTPAPIISECNV